MAKKKENTITITQVRSAIRRPASQKRTLVALGLTKLNKPREVVGSPQVLGMIKKVEHLLKIETK
jgi:large subunit ribosomal protein L30